MNLKQELESRGFLHQYTHEEVFDLFENGGKKFYLGVDLSADSMTIGNFVALMMAIRIMLRGNSAYLLVGGATSTIGNPSGKDNERPILTDEQLQHNMDNIHKQFDDLCKNVSTVTGKVLDYKIVNNKDFFVDMNVLDYLKEVGRHITVNRMLGKDIVRKRVTDPDKFISYAEFSYMLIMGYDFYHLYSNEDVIMQIGGSDERDGIITGVELIGKKLDKTAYGITNKLIVDSTGKKFGKSEGNAIWLDPSKNHPYVCYNYFTNTTDEDVEKYLKIFSMLSLEEIEKIALEHNQEPQNRYGQRKLAYLVTEIVFGTQAAQDCELINKTIYEGDPVENLGKLDDKQLVALNAATGETNAPGGRILDLLTQSGLCESNGEAKKAIKNNAVSLNENKISDIGYEISDDDRINGKILLLRKGKKTYKTVLRT